MPTITIELTNAQMKALTVVRLDPIFDFTSMVQGQANALIAEMANGDEAAFMALDIKTAAQRAEETRLAAELSASTGGQVTVANGVPSSVTMAQARIALQQAGMLQTVADGLNSLPDGPGKDAALTAWEYSPNVSRTGALVLTLGTQLGFTDQQLDDLFRAAGSVNL